MKLSSTRKPRRIFSSILGSVLLLSQLACPAFALENWPMYNHDAGLTGRTGQFVNGPVSLVWEKQYSTAPHVRAQAVVVDNVIYQGFMDGSLKALDLANGNEKWSVNTGGTIPGSAVVVANQVVVPVNKIETGEIISYSLTGTQKWKVTSDYPFFASPIHYRGFILVGGLDEQLYAIDAEDGKIIWKKQLDGRVFSPVAAANGTIVVMTDHMKGYAFDISGTKKWEITIPNGEYVGHSHPLIAQNTVLFQFGGRAGNTPALEEQPYRGTNPLAGTYTAASLLSANSTVLTNNPQMRTSYAVDIGTGQRKFDINIGTPYWGQLTSKMLTDRLLLKHAYANAWSVDMVTGETKWLYSNDMDGMFRRDEYAYSSVGGGGREYGSVADDLGVANHISKTFTVLVGDFWTHYTSQWLHKIDSNNKFTFIIGPGDGNSGYSGTPIVYDDKIIWFSNASWLQVHRGTKGHEAPDTTAPQKPTDVSGQADGNTVTLTWAPATDNIKTTEYLIFRNNALIGQTDETRFVDRSLSNQTTYEYTIRSSDIQSNLSAASTPISTTTGTGTPDPSPTTAPNTCPTDINLSGGTDIDDYVILVRDLLQPVLSNPRSNIDGIGDVDLTDYSLLVAKFLQNCE